MLAIHFWTLHIRTHQHYKNDMGVHLLICRKAPLGERTISYHSHHFCHVPCVIICMAKPNNSFNISIESKNEIVLLWRQCQFQMPAHTKKWANAQLTPSKLLWFLPISSSKNDWTTFIMYLRTLLAYKLMNALNERRTDDRKEHKMRKKMFGDISTIYVEFC